MTEHTIGDDDYLYCLVPLDENATVSVNLMRWDSKSDTEEVIEVLYRSEVGDPLLIFAAGGDDAYAYLSYIQVQIVDNAGNSCVWEPQLYTSTGHIVPCFSENGDYLSFDFTEYGWQGVSFRACTVAGRRLERRLCLRAWRQLDNAGSGMGYGPYRKLLPVVLSRG